MISEHDAQSDARLTLETRVKEEISAGYMVRPVQLPTAGCAFCGTQADDRQYGMGPMFVRDEEARPKKTYLAIVLGCEPCARAADEAKHEALRQQVLAKGRSDASLAGGQSS